MQITEFMRILTEQISKFEHRFLLKLFFHVSKKNQKSVCQSTELEKRTLQEAKVNSFVANPILEHTNYANRGGWDIMERNTDFFSSS